MGTGRAVVCGAAVSDDRPVFLSLFAGVGGFDLALERAGFRCAGQVEINRFGRRVLRERFPHARLLRDVRRFRGTQAGRLVRALWANESEGRADIPRDRDSTAGDRELYRAAGRIDLLVGGFPCQDLSIAGKRAGLGGSRSALFYEIVRIAKILRPTWGIFENVPGLLSSTGGYDMGLVLAGLRECWPAVGYRVLDSRWFGVPQRRRRVFFVCGPDEARVREVLFEPDGGAGDSAAGVSAGARVAAGLTAGSHRAGVSDAGRRREDDDNLVIAETLNSAGNDGGFRTEPGAHLVVASSITSTSYQRHDDDTDTLIVAKPLKAGGNDRQDESHETYVVAPPTIGFAWQSGGDARMNPREEEQGALHAGQVPAVAYQQHGTNVGEMGALRAGNGNETGGVPFVMNLRGREEGARPELDDQASLRAADGGSSRSYVAHALSAEGADASEDGTGRGTPIIAQPLTTRRGGSGGDCTANGAVVAPTLNAYQGRNQVEGQYAATGPMIVRRLTPTECARLQAFPDGWCCLCQPLSAWAADPEAAANACVCPDSPQYRAYGNAVTVNVVQWIGERLMTVMQLDR